MSLPPQKFREIVYQILFSASFDPSEIETTAHMLMSELKVTRRAVLDACEKTREVIARLAGIDEKIRAASNSYEFDRISSVEKCALRLGVFELNFDSSLPGKVVISEAIRLTRKFGTSEGAGFVNAILDAIQKHDLELAARPTA